MTRSCTCTGSLASTLELSSKRNQAAETSCKSCGGKPLVGGIEPISASMLSTVDLELTKFINPELSWKTVTKGRRPRKPAARSFNLGSKVGNKSPKRARGLSVSESEKLGVAVLGQRFSDKVVHIPIKKRRVLLKAPSPPPQTPSPYREESLLPQPQTPSPDPEDFNQLLDRKCASGQSCQDSFSKQQVGAFGISAAVKFSDGIRVINDKFPEMTNEKLCYTDDFSGIALLAAAACDNAKENPVVEEFSTPEGFDSSTSTMPSKETHDLIKDGINDSSLRHNSVSFSQNLHDKHDVGAVKRSVPLEDHRLHWDLNTIMDDWKQPCDDLERNVSDVFGKGMQCEKPENLASCDTHKDSEGSRYDMEGEVQSRVSRIVSVDVGKHHMHVDPKGTALGPSKLCMEEKELEACSGHERTCIKEKYVSDSDCHIQGTSDSAGADLKASSQVVDMDASLNSSSCSASRYNSSRCASEEKMSSSSFSVVQNSEDCCTTSVMQLSKTISLETVHSGEHDVALPDVAVSEGAVWESTQTEHDDENFGKTFGLTYNKTSLIDVISLLGTRKVLDIKNSFSDCDKLDPSHFSPKCEESSVSGVSVGEGHVVIDDTKGKVDKASAADAIEIDSPIYLGPKDFMPKTCDHFFSEERAQAVSVPHDSCKSYSHDSTSPCPGKIASPSDDRNNSHVSQDDRSHVVGVENTIDLQAGYDSPIEDGELRESVVHSWEENEVEDWETECVDYESDDIGGADTDASDYLMPEKVEVGYEGSQIVDKGSSFATKVTEAIFCKSGSAKTSSSGIAIEQSASMTMEVNDNGVRKNHTSIQMDGLNVKGSYVGEVGSRPSRGKKLSSSLDALDRKDSMLVERSRLHNLGGSNSRADRDFDFDKTVRRDRSSMQVRERNEGDGCWVDSSVHSWNSRNCYPPSYRDTEGHGRSRARSVIDNSVAQVGGLNYHERRQSMNYSSRGMYRPPIRRRSPVDRDDCFGGHRGLPPVRGISRDRIRGRSGIYPQGVDRGFGEEYHELVPAAASPRIPHYLSRRERSFSSAFSRGARIARPCRKSRSRSRTRSPPAWLLQRGQNLGTRRECRSPDLRCEARMDRMRMPFQKPIADYEESLMSPPRGRRFSQHSSRWVDNRNCVDDHFRDRRSPARLFRRKQMFDSVSSGRLKSDDYFRPMIRPVRYPLVAGAGRGRKYEDSGSDRSKHDDRCEMIHRGRCYETDGLGRQFRYDAEDHFEAHDSRIEDDCVRGTDQRDVSRSVREERGSFRDNNVYRKHAAPSSGQPDYDENTSPRRG